MPSASPLPRSNQAPSTPPAGPSSSLASSPPLHTKRTKDKERVGGKSHTLAQRQSAHKQQQQQHEPWLFQSLSVLQSPPPQHTLLLPQRAVFAAPTSLPSISLPSQEGSPHGAFYLDVDSLRSLLPATGRRRRAAVMSTTSHSDQSVPHRGGATTRTRHRQAPPPRLDTLAVTTARRKGRRRPRMSSASSPFASSRPAAVHRRLALRLDAVKARHRNDSDGGHGNGGGASEQAVFLGFRHKSRSTPHDHGDEDEHDDQDDESDDENAHQQYAAHGARTPSRQRRRALTRDDAQEQRRQQAAIAAQLGLTEDEYAALDAAFAGSSHNNRSSDGIGARRRHARAHVVMNKDQDQEDDDEENNHTNDTEMDRYRAVLARLEEGAISATELHHILRAAGEDMPEEELTRVIAQADADGDGAIDAHEFLALMRARKRLLHVAQTMSGVMRAGRAPPPTKTMLASSSSSCSPSPATVSLPPLRAGFTPSPGITTTTSHGGKKQRNMLTNYSNTTTTNSVIPRETPRCLRANAPHADAATLRRELALAEYGLQQLNARVREDVHWVQTHCPVRALQAQRFCHRWGRDKLHALFQRLTQKQLARGFYQWRSLLVFERNKLRATRFLQCKGSQKLSGIMTRWRLRVTRRCLVRWRRDTRADRRQERHAAALELQRLARGWRARRWRHAARRDRGARMLQALVRGHLARLQVQRWQHELQREQAATRLQRCYRGYNGKRVAQALFRAQREVLAARRIQRGFRHHQRRALLRVIQRSKLEHDAAIVLQCRARIWLARRVLATRKSQERRRQSAIQVQRCLRGWLARRRCRALRRRRVAALQIQTRYRAYRSRWHCYQLRQERDQRQRHAQEHAAAVHIQSRWRGAQARHFTAVQRQQRRDQEKLIAFRRFTSALLVQRVFRGFRARREAQRRRYEALLWMNATALTRSALLIQACWRGFQGRRASLLRSRAMQALHDEKERAARCLQAQWRVQLARHEATRRREARAAGIRAHQCRQRAALMIQTRFRGLRARRRAHALRDAHQQKARLALARLVDQTKHRAATRIQCLVRRFLARQRYLTRRRDVERAAREREQARDRERAAVVIQGGMRRALARWRLRVKRHEMEKRLSLMASEKAQHEIERLREEQEAELAKLRVELVLQQQQAAEQAAALQRALDEQQREQEQSQQTQDAQELARLRLEALMLKQQHEEQQQQMMSTAARKQLEREQRQREQEVVAQHLREELEREKQQQQQQEALVRTQENEDLIRLKMTAILHGSTPTSRATTASHALSDPHGGSEMRPSDDHSSEADRASRQLALEAQRLQRASTAMQQEQARLKIRGVCLRYLASRRLQRLQREQAEALAHLHSAEEKQRVKALQDKEMALAKLRAMMDEETRAREQELQALETQMVERARLEKERIARRNTAARRIQCRARGFLARLRVRAIQQQVERERVNRAQALADKLAAAEAKVEEAIKATELELDAATDTAGNNDELGGEGATTAMGNPEDWVEYWDENAQASYFYNIVTQEASWTRPFSAPSSTPKAAAQLAVDAMSAPVDYEADPYAGYPGYTTAAAAYTQDGSGAQGYADEYGFYDQYGQYHYYEESAQNNTAIGAYRGAAPPTYSGYAAAAAAYAYQAAMAFGAPMYGGGATAGGGFAMGGYGAPMMATESDGMTTTGTSTVEAAPPDPWEKFFDQYTGAPYYCNSMTGERYWA